MSKRTVVIDNPDLPRIESVWAFLSTDPVNGAEGICAFYSPALDKWVPMVWANETHTEAMRKAAQELAALARSKIRLVRFHAREDLEEIKA